MISFAQNHEDVLLRRLFPDSTDGFYIDVGANHPVYHSVTKHFYDRGWRGINIEPVPTVFEELRAQRDRDLNLCVGVSNREGSLTFYGPRGIDCWSASLPCLIEIFGADPDQLVEREVAVTTLASICEQHVDRPIAFL